MSDTKATETNPPAPDRIHDDTPCLACGYNLRSIQISGSCPECGLKADYSIRAKNSITKRELAALVFRVVLLWIAIGTIVNLSVSLTFIWRDLFHGALATVGTLVVVAGLGILWWKIGFLARLAFPLEGQTGFIHTVSSQYVMLLAVSLIGLWHACSALITLAWIGIITAFNLDSGPRLTDSLIQLIIGLVLIVGAQRIAQLVLWLRTAGTVQTEADSEISDKS